MAKDTGKLAREVLNLVDEIGSRPAILDFGQEAWIEFLNDLISALEDRRDTAQDELEDAK